MTGPWPAQLVVATHNPGKAAEWRALLGPVDTAADLGLPEPDETGATFAANAALKARAAMQATGRPCLAEDAGLVVPALDGRPGVRTRRAAHTAGGWSALADALLDALGTDRTPAFYVCALALVGPDGEAWSAEARAPGYLVRPRGEGPGLAPAFQPFGSTTTWAELGPDWRRAHDHRARALVALREALGA